MKCSSRMAWSTISFHGNALQFVQLWTELCEHPIAGTIDRAAIDAIGE